MDVDLVNNEVIFLQDKLKGYSLTGAENKFDEKGEPLKAKWQVVSEDQVDFKVLSNIFRFFQATSG